jgi:hypothetical protein
VLNFDPNKENKEESGGSEDWEDIEVYPHEDELVGVIDRELERELQR